MQAHLGLLVDSITGTMRMAAAEAAAAASTASMVGDRLGPHQAQTSTRAQAQGSATALPGPGLPSGVQSSGARLDRVPGMDDMEELRLYDVLGEGAGGAVFRGTLGTVPVAVKLMEVPALDEQDERDEQEAAAERQAIEMLLSTGGGGAKAGPGPAHAACAAADDISGEWEAALESEAEARDAETRAEAAAARRAKALRRRESAHLSAKRALYRNAMELAVLCSTAHVNIVQCHAVYDSVVLARGEESGPQGMPGIVLRRSRGKAVDGGSPVCTAIVTELCDSSLAAVLESRTFPPGLAVGRQRVMDMRAVYMTLLEIALALRHLHSRRLVHRDVKPANVLLKHCSTDPRGWTSKLADFGFALVLDRQENPVASSAQHSGYASSSRNADPGAASGAACSGASGLARSGVGSSSLGSGASGAAPSSGSSGVNPCCCYYTVQDSACGTITHIAPEATQPNSRVDASVDVYALGIIMWELVAGRGSRPYKDLRSGAILNAVTSGVRPVFPESVPQAYRDLAQACWVADPQRRPSAAEVVALLKAQYARCSAAAARAQQQAAEASAAAAASASAASPRPCDR